MSEAACRALLGATKRQSMSKTARNCVACQSVLSAGHQARPSSSNSRWKMRQGKDIFAREAKVQGLKSRAAFKLLEMDAKYHFFRKGQTVVDLVAVERTKPNGQVLGIDLIPAQPPRGVSTIQGNFLSPDVQAMVKDFLVRAKRQRAKKSSPPPAAAEGETDEDLEEGGVIEDKPSYIDMERATSETTDTINSSASDGAGAKNGRLVDIVLSDMSAPWDQTTGFGVNTLSNPYSRMMNTSGMAFRDHAGSMDLCDAALQFASDTLRNNGHFVCKFYQGSEDKLLEKKLRSLFVKVFREKPDSSRSDSREAYFVALKRKGNVQLEADESM
ncbi:rRNA methyltransferase 2, mitochondrial [Colletotrichum chlorophyti]|uniref:rRNA methyltransferase 2, mitochondrial n=1 Tax=Colletotrichum chlorophyti TaxID=708187 RepID=A0A1Q8RPQ9_9PEZI|nr:rRNA methyltransferase 2, mitochondrial [Colletotrichum chlorophyti]